jgi:hypothetical protein
VKSIDGAGNAAVSSDKTLQTPLQPAPDPEPQPDPGPAPEPEPASAPSPDNRKPVLGVLPDVEVAESERVTMTLVGTDPDGDPLTYSSSALPQGAVLNGAEFSWTPNYAQAGSETVTFVVSDGSLTDSETVVMTVTDVNRPPIVSAGADQAVALPAAAKLDGTVNDPDQPAQPAVAWSQVSGPGTVAFADAASAKTTATCTTAGTYVLLLTGDDGVTKASDEVTLIVNGASPVSGVLEAETMPVKTTGEPVPDGWNLWSRGHVEGSLEVAGGEYDLRVIARGSPVRNSWPQMHLRVDGRLVAVFAVTSDTWKTYAIRHSLSAGSHTIRVAFTNDLYAPPEDRNLYVDKVQVASLLTPPAAPASSDRIILEAEKMPVKTAGGSVTSGWNLWSNGYIQDSLEFPAAAAYAFEIVARGTKAQQQYPIMELRIDGVVAGTFTVNSKNWKSFTVDVPVSAGNHAVSVAFTNDYYASGQDRNLYVDKVVITQVP